MTPGPTGMSSQWLTEPHHDGSPLYVEPGPYTLGDDVKVGVRVPAGRRIDHVVLRSIVDGEPLLTEATIDRSTSTDTWWAADLKLANPVASYRFAFEGGGTTRWLNAAGISEVDVTDAADFRLATHSAPPAWLADAVGYQIFPDRFARGGLLPEPPSWAIPADWDDPLMRDGRSAVRQWYGGDLAGIEARLDHVADLGADLIYLTPFFPARSTHRYDATTFDRVDPLLGGDAALASLATAAHVRGIRVVGDLTLNHTGDHHDWFERAQADATSPEAGFYMFRRHPDDYVAWYDVPTLPKLDHRSAELERRLTGGPDSVAGRWLRPPFELDGWRVRLRQHDRPPRRRRPQRRCRPGDAGRHGGLRARTLVGRRARLRPVGRPRRFRVARGDGVPVVHATPRPVARRPRTGPHDVRPPTGPPRRRRRGTVDEDARGRCAVERESTPA